MGFPKTISFSGILTSALIEGLVLVAPDGQAVIDFIFIGVDLDRVLLHIGKHLDHHFPAALQQA